MTNTKINTSKFVALMLVCYGCIALATAGAWGVIETSEARYAEIAREMMRSGDWLHPTLLSVHHYHKPPLTYWITAAGLNLFGVNDFGARFFLQLYFLLQVYLVYRIALQLFSVPITALSAAVIYSGLAIVLVSVRGLTTDGYLNTFVLIAIFYWFLWNEKRQHRWLYLSFVALGLCFFTKGPVGFLIPVLVMFSVRPYSTMSQRSSPVHFVSALLICLVISFGWFAYLIFVNKDFLDYFVVRHTIERFSQADVFTRKQPWWYFLCYGPLLGLPWVGVFFFIRKSEYKQMPSVVKRILYYWILLPLLFFSISSSKLVLYILPIYSGVAMICGWFFNTIIQHHKKFENAFFSFLCFFGAVVILAFVFADPIKNYYVSLMALLWLVVLFSIRFKISWASHKTLLYSVAWTCFLIAFSSVVFNRNELLVNSTKPLADWVIANDFKDRNIIIYNNLLPSLSYELDKDIISVNDGNRYLNREVEFEQDHRWKGFLYDLKDPEDEKTLIGILKQPSILICKGEIAENRKWLTQNYSGRVIYGKWIVFYN